MKKKFHISLLKEKVLSTKCFIGVTVSQFFPLEKRDQAPRP